MKKNYHFLCTEDDMLEILDLGDIHIELARLVNENADIGAFFMKKILERDEQYLINEGYDHEDDAREYYQSIQREEFLPQQNRILARCGANQQY